MAGSDNSEVGCNQLQTPYYTPCLKQTLQKHGLQPVNMDLSPSSGGNSSLASTMKEGSGSPSLSSSDSEPESLAPSATHDDGLPVNTDGEGLPEGVIKLKEEFHDLKQQDQMVGEEKTDNILWGGDIKSYAELLQNFRENEEELEIQLSLEEIIELKNQVEEETMGQLQNVQKELKLKQDDIEYEIGQVPELKNQTADFLEAHAPDCCYTDSNLIGQLEVANEQLRVSYDEIARLKEELVRKSSGTQEVQGQLQAAQKNVATLECQLDSGRKRIQELEDRITWYKTNETNHELEVQKLKAEMVDAQAKIYLEKDQLHSDMVILLEAQKQLDSKLLELGSRSNELENKSRQYEAEKLKQEKLHATRQMVLQDEISSLKEELGQRRRDVEAVNKDFDEHKQKYDMLMTERDGAKAKIDNLMAEISSLKEELGQKRHDVEAVNKDFDRHKQKYDMLMTERDEAKAKIDELMAELSSRDNEISNMVRELFQLRTQQVELISGSKTRQNLVNELKLKVEELEKEVTRQNAVISDRAEEKREAIRQLCFSLEHYRSGYQELLQAFTGHKGHAVTAS